MLCFILSWLNKPQLSLPHPGPILNVLILKFWGMGSILLLIPGLKEFKKAHPDCHITVVTLAQNRELASMIPELDSIETLDFQNGLLVFLSQTALLIKKFRAKQFDIVFDLEFFTRFSAIFSFLCRGSQRVGFHDRSSFRGNLHHVEIPFNSYWHGTDTFTYAFLQKKGLKVLPATPWIKVPELDQRTIEHLFLERGWLGTNRQPIVCINPNAGPLGLERRWPSAHFRQLISMLLAQTSLRIVIIGSLSDRSYDEEIVASFMEQSSHRERLFLSAGQLNLAQLAAMISISDLLVSNDSGPLHLGVAVGIPTISLFGPETPVLYGPQGAGHLVLYKNLPCSPCINVFNNKTLFCRVGSNQCLTDISPAEVFEAIRRRFNLP